ncbi:MAG TPA: MMPL family transporter [Candidatus Moranbacteria bacterium]|nr:MMPL family transporter [Candidatus Moranbacteria bacterium]
MEKKLKNEVGWKNWMVLAVFLLLTIFFSAGWIPRIVGDYSAGILEDGILDSNNFIVRADEFVESFREEGFLPLEISALILPTQNKQIGEADLLLQEQLHQKLEDEFTDCGFISLRNFPNPKLSEDELDTSAYLSDEILYQINSQSWQQQEWFRELSEKFGPKGLLFGEDQSFIRMLMVFPDGYNENAMRNRLANFLEKREVPWYWWLIKSDIEPREEYSGIKVVDWTIGRALMSSMLNSNTIRMMAMGLFLTWFFCWKTLRSPRQASIITSMLLAEFIWIKGAIGWMFFVHTKTGLFSFWGHPLRETVFILLVYAFVIIGGISFTSRYMEAFNESRSKGVGLKAAFRRAYEILLVKFVVVVVIGLSNFLSLYQIGTRAIMEVGMLCSIAMLQIVFLALVVQKAFYLFLEKVLGPERIKHGTSEKALAIYSWCKKQANKIFLGWLVEVFATILIEEKWNRWLDSIVKFSYYSITEKSSYRFLGWITPLTPARSIAVVSVFLSLFLFVCLAQYLAFVAPEKYSNIGRIQFDEKPIGYMSRGNFIQGTEIVNALDTGTAQARAPFLVLPRDASQPLPELSDPDYWKEMKMQVKRNSPQDEEEGWQEVGDPHFLARAEEFQGVVKGVYGVRQVWSAIDGLQDYSRELYGSSLPQTREEAHDAFESFRNKLEESQNGWMVVDASWFKRGIALSIFVPADSANQMKDMTDDILRISREQFLDLVIAPFGQLHIYAQTAHITSIGKAENIFTSFFWVYGIVVIWIGFCFLIQKNKKLAIFKLSPWRAGFAVAVPFVFAFSITGIVMWIFKIPMDQASACATAFGVNAAIDFNIYFIDDYRVSLTKGALPEKALKTALLENGRPMIVDCLLNAVCFLPLAFSSFVPISRLGLTLSGMMILCGFGAMVLMPAMLRLCIIMNKNWSGFIGVSKPAYMKL